MKIDPQKPRPASAPVILTMVTVAVSLMPAGCLHWPDAPYMDAAKSLPEGVAEQLQSAFPGATPTTPVYRKHVEGLWGEYVVVSRWFLFEDSAGKTHRAVVDEGGRLSATEAETLDRLPDGLHALFFEGRSAMVSQGRPIGRVWRFKDASTQETSYEFEFEADGQRGLGAVSESGRRRSAHHFVDRPE